MNNIESSSDEESSIEFIEIIYSKLQKAKKEIESLKKNILEQNKEKEKDASEIEYLKKENDNQRKEIIILGEKLEEAEKRPLKSKNIITAIATTSTKSSNEWAPTKFKSTDLKDFNILTLLPKKTKEKSYSQELLNNYAKKVFNGELKLKEAFLALKKTIPYSTLFDRVKLLKGFNFFIINLKFFRLIKLNF